MQFYVPSLPLYGTLGQASDARIQFQNVRAVSRIAQRVSVAGQLRARRACGRGCGHAGLRQPVQWIKNVARLHCVWVRVSRQVACRIVAVGSHTCRPTVRRDASSSRT